MLRHWRRIETQNLETDATRHDQQVTDTEAIG